MWLRITAIQSISPLHRTPHSSAKLYTEIDTLRSCRLRQKAASPSSIPTLLPLPDRCSSCIHYTPPVPPPPSHHLLSTAARAHMQFIPMPYCSRFSLYVSFSKQRRPLKIAFPSQFRVSHIHGNNARISFGSVYVFVNVARETRTIISWRWSGCRVTPRPALPPAPLLKFLLLWGIKCLLRFPPTGTAEEKKRRRPHCIRAGSPDEMRRGQLTEARVHGPIITFPFQPPLPGIDFSFHKTKEKTKNKECMKITKTHVLGVSFIFKFQYRCQVCRFLIPLKINKKNEQKRRKTKKACK